MASPIVCSLVDFSRTVLGLRRRQNGGTGVLLIYLAAPGDSEADTRLLTLWEWQIA